MNTITYIISEETYTSKNKQRRSYGVVICSKMGTDGISTIIDSVKDVSMEKCKIQNLVNECNRLKLSPIHFREVIEDFI